MGWVDSLTIILGIGITLDAIMMYWFKQKPITGCIQNIANLYWDPQWEGDPPYPQL